MQKLDYYILKVKYELIFKDLEKSFQVLNLNPIWNDKMIISLMIEQRNFIQFYYITYY